MRRKKRLRRMLRLELLINEGWGGGEMGRTFQGSQATLIIIEIKVFAPTETNP